jgi:hypothetical protein
VARVKPRRAPARKKAAKKARPTKAAPRKAAKKKAPRRAAPKKVAKKKAAPKKLAAPKPRAKKLVAAKPVPKPARRPSIPPTSSRGRPDDADAFLRDRSDGKARKSTRDDFAEELAEDFVGSATSGEDQALEARDSVGDEEVGGPFVTTPAKREFAEGLDASNPEDTEREPFPTATSQRES